MGRRRRQASPARAAAAAEGPLTATTATCPVCLSVLLRPVTMPCRHTLCMPCFDSTVEQAALSCPLCRTRISVWLRKARRAGSLVDEPLWSRLQRDFPDKVQARLEGREADFSEEDQEPVAPLLSAPGEIRREFEQQLEAVRDEDQERRSRSERASRELIDRLQEETAEETRQRQEQERQDAEVARGVMREEQLFLSPGRPAVVPAGGRQRPAGSGGGPLRGPMDVYVGQLTPRVGGKRPVSPIQPRAAPAPANRAPPVDGTPSPAGSEKENSDPSAVGGGRYGRSHSSDSSDSIRAELRHFKPIRAAPRTPPKRRPDGVLGAPPVVHAVARALDRPADGAKAGWEVQGPRSRTGGGEGEAVDAGGGGDSGEDGVRVAAGKRPADERQAGGRAAKRRPPPTATVTAATGAGERELPFLAPPREPSPDWEQLDLNSAELLEQQREAERLLQLELADRRLAEQLQRELNTVPPVDRSRGSADAYSLRGAGWGHSGTPAGPSRRRPAAGGRRPAGRRDRAQLSIQESIGRSTRARSPEW